MCANGGPPINVTTMGMVSVCTGNLAQTTFTWALCSCTDVSTQDTLLTDAFNSANGPYPQSSTLGGSVGVDGSFNSGNAVTIGGSLWDSASSGVTSDSSLTVKEELHSGGPVNVQAASFGLDAFVNGAVSGGTYSKSLTVPNGITPSATVNGMIIHVPPPVSVPTPCDCKPADLIPVSSIVMAHATTNDNALIGLHADVLAGPGAPARLDLPCGNYYLSSINSNVPVTIVAHGHTALYIGGNISPSSGLTITLDPTATLDLFVRGTISTSDTLVIGNVNYPALSRTYVGGSGTISFQDGVTLASNLYAPNASVDWAAGTDIYGSVFCHNFVGSARVAIHYDTAVLSQGASCPPENGPPGPGSDAGPDANGVPPGDGGTTCMTCMNCGNQACVNGTCGQCTSSAQCCAPLICVLGTCEVAPP
jgi:hypothetical protein